MVVRTAAIGSKKAFDRLGSAAFSLTNACTNHLTGLRLQGRRDVGRESGSEAAPISAPKGSADMVDDYDANDPSFKAFSKAVNYAVEQTGTPSDRLTRDDFLTAAALAEESGDLKMTQRLLLLVEDQELHQGEG